MKVLRYGHLRSAPVVVDATGVRTEWEPPTLRAALSALHAFQSWRLHDGLLPLQRRAKTVCRVVAVQDIAMRSLLLQVVIAKIPEVRERCTVRRLPFVYCAFGLCRSVRSPVSQSTVTTEDSL